MIRKTLCGLEFSAKYAGSSEPTSSGVVISLDMTYEYACKSCNHKWEAQQKITDEALDTCPKCDEKTAQRQISGGTGHILKGGGWFKDGY